MSEKKINPLAGFGKAGSKKTVETLEVELTNVEPVKVEKKGKSSKRKTIVLEFYAGDEDLRMALKKESFDTDVPMRQIVMQLLRTRYERALKQG